MALNFAFLDTILEKQLINMFYEYFMSILCSGFYGARCYSVHKGTGRLHYGKWQLS